MADDSAIAALTAAVDRMSANMSTGFRTVKTDMDLLAHQFENLETDMRHMQEWRARVDERLKKNSVRAAAPSETDLTLQARQAEEIVKNLEQDRRLDEIKDMVVKIDTAATARGEVLDGIAASVSRALRSKMAEKIAYAFGGFILAAIAYYARKFGVPQP